MELIEAAREFLLMVKEELDQHTTRKGSVVIDSPTRVTLFTPSHIQFAKYGRKPGKQPPLDPIIEWVKAKGILFEGLSEEGTAWAIAKSIEKKGTKNYVPNAPNAIDEALTKNYEAYNNKLRGMIAISIEDELWKDNPPFPRKFEFKV